MKTAFAYWDNRIAPVFDIARRIHVVETDSGQIVNETEVSLAEDQTVQKAGSLVELGVGTLVCGAISKPLHDMIVAYGIKIIPFVAGDLHKVIEAWLQNDLERDDFAMPGCCRRRKFHGYRHCSHSKSYAENIFLEPSNKTERRNVMPQRDGTGPTGKGPGSGRGMGRCGGQGKQSPGAQSDQSQGGGQGKGQGQGGGKGQGRRRGFGFGNKGGK